MTTDLTRTDHFAGGATGTPAVSNGDDPFKRSRTEKYRGHTIGINKGKEWGTLAGHINGNPQLIPHGGTTNAHAERGMQSLRGTVDHAIEHPDNYTNGSGDHVLAKGYAKKYR